MKKIREIIFVTSLSFTLVILLNTVLIYIQNTSYFDVFDIFAIFFCCLVIACVIALGDSFHFGREHPMIYSYCVMFVIANILNFIFFKHDYWQNIMIQSLFLTFVYIGVSLGVFGIHRKDANLINKKLEKSRNET